MAHVETRKLNMRHQAQKGFRGVFVGIPEHQKGYLVYVNFTRNIICSYDVVFGGSFSSALAYTSRPYSEAMVMRTSVTYTPYARLREKKLCKRNYIASLFFRRRSIRGIRH